MQQEIPRGAVGLPVISSSVELGVHLAPWNATWTHAALSDKLPKHIVGNTLFETRQAGLAVKNLCGTASIFQVDLESFAFIRLHLP